MSNGPKAKDYRHGKVPNDGNGMVGGKWWGMKRLAYKDIKVSDLTECITDTDKAEKALEWLEERIGETFRVEAYFHIGSDESVGMPEICEWDEGFDPEQKVFDAIKTCPYLDGEAQAEMMFDLANICEDEDGYEFYEIDVPERD